MMEVKLQVHLALNNMQDSSDLGYEGYKALMLKLLEGIYFGVLGNDDCVKIFHDFRHSLTMEHHVKFTMRMFASFTRGSFLFHLKSLLPEFET